ncbi:gamma-butyrobetaine hydroxylase-like domain-containing protein [Alkalimarinus sediminis]|uniref:DUF971 domain-containing protein n=1 Tax=Alkalimarinus sediminis TaxID=1632866 RepID=A0A9E8HG52_9ALTE|nr:DUF971 domain-containing protein [Alkalimarinus sediminis]UZW74038.1 DUF971 domain-containing protein [Alkalimarinus sediminis]
MATAPRPTQIKLQTQSKCLELTYSDTERYALSFEFLRVLSPSAEVRGHGPGSAVLQTGKKDVNITLIEPAGNYALKITYSDGHDSGLYTWDYLYDLCCNEAAYWEDYLQQLADAGASR